MHAKSPENQRQQVATPPSARSLVVSCVRTSPEITCQSRQIQDYISSHFHSGQQEAVARPRPGHMAPREVDLHELSCRVCNVFYSCFLSVIQRLTHTQYPAWWRYQPIPTNLISYSYISTDARPSPWLSGLVVLIRCGVFAGCNLRTALLCNMVLHDIPVLNNCFWPRCCLGP